MLGLASSEGLGRILDHGDATLKAAVLLLPKYAGQVRELLMCLNREEAMLAVEGRVPW